MTNDIATREELQLEYEALTAWVLAHRPEQILAYAPRVHLLALQVRRGERAPQLLDPPAPIHDRGPALAEFVRWLNQPAGSWHPAEVATLLNGLDQTTLRGRPWSQQTVRWLLQRYPGGAR